MADDLSIQFVSFTFASRTFAYNCLSQGVKKSVTGFSSFVKNYLDPCLAANVCTQFMDDIADGVNNLDEMIAAVRENFDSLRESGLKLSLRKFEIGTKEIHYLGSTITSREFHSKVLKLKMFWNSLENQIQYNK